MKKLLTFLTIVVLGTTMWAQAPQGINYQAVARDASGNVLDAVQGTVRISILDAIGGNVLYQEEHSVTTNQFGLFNVLIGQGTALQGSFSTVNWSLGDKYLQVEADFGNGYEDMGTTQLVSVPYALYAETSGDGPPGKNSLVTTSPTTTTCPNGGYTVTVGIDLNGNNILDAGESTGTFEVCNGQNGSSTLVAGDGIDIDYLTNTVSNTGDLDSLDDKITNAILNGNVLEITEGGTVWMVDLSTFTNTDNQNLSNGGKTGNNQTINIQNGTGVTFSVADADSVVGNEYNTAFAVNAGNLEITDGGGTLSVPLSSLTDGDWIANGNDMYNANTGNVGIGTTTPEAKLHVALPNSTATKVLQLGHGNQPSREWSFDVDAISKFTINNEGNGTPFTAMAIDPNTGNVGVGTSTPSATLHLNGTFRLQDGTQANGYVLISDANGNASWVNPTTISTADDGDWVTGANGVYNTTDNIGIGISNPNYKFHIQQTLSTTTPMAAIINGHATGDAALRFTGGATHYTIGCDASDGSFIIANSSFNLNTNPIITIKTANVGIGTTTPGAKLHIALPNSAATKVLQLGHGNQPGLEWSFDVDATSLFTVNNEGNGTPFTAMAINPNTGNVGIGTVSPATKLQVTSNSATTPELTIENTSNGRSVTFNSNGEIEAASGQSLYLNRYVNGNVILALGGGNVGIGTTLPKSLLHVHGTSSGRIQITNQNTFSNTTDGLWIDVNSLGAVSFLNRENTNMYFGTNAVNRMVITNVGDVGIGTNTPTSKLDVNGNVTATGFIVSSDKRYKHTITPLIQATELILQIKPVSYYFNKNMKNKNFDNRLHYGLIAQDLEKIMPNIVHTDKEGYKSVNYVEIVPVLIKAIQEQQQMIEALQQELKQIKEQLK